ncbi:Uncharacterized conserved protein, DUF1501 family [Albimonas donghaensis]|uniref:Uncharacterized conserved protein, DUF1501 family n=2 Tax=Albimonas donghaensis TaxID=356660 RepID=A0A1H3ARK0_9RHOB|nr:Uncharacterized conserved protein, DUF1501 family [Albimonas donghaensis]
MDLTRRALLRGGLTLGCSAAAFPLMTRVTFAAAPGDNRLVVIVLRGALDGLAAVEPYGDRDLAAMRPTLTTAGKKGSVDLDGRFAMHPALSPLAPLWGAGELSFVHAVSTPYRDKRSHFDGQDLLENGGGRADGGMTSGRDGWLNRALGLLPGAKAQTAIAVGRENMLLLDGDNPALSWSPDSDLALTPQALDLYRMISAQDPLFDAAAREAAALDAERDMAGGEAARRVDAASLAALSADMLRGEARIAAFSLGGYDTHRDQDRTIRKPLGQLAEAITTLKAGLGPIWERTAVMCVTEFGRTARENGSRGTDHGTGGLMVYAGGALSGAKVHGDWPGLKPSDLYQDRDLAPTDDLRRHAAWTLRGLFGMEIPALEREVFPGVSMGSESRILA